MDDLRGRGRKDWPDCSCARVRERGKVETEDREREIDVGCERKMDGDGQPE